MKPDFSTRLRDAARAARGELLAARTPEGCWAGELSPSALSTATAVTALALVARHSAAGLGAADPLVQRGLGWLAQHVNPDGGWGDTILSHSNLSTTTLAWAAFGAVPGADQHYRSVVAGAVAWLSRAAGGTDPAQLVPAIVRRYGKDRTFSVPILTLCALAGRLGDGPAAWRWVPALPFELAACPHRWFAALRLPVVSYALPALIAIGQVRHHHRPSRNPLTRLARHLSRGRTLQVLAEIQPASGGFLEATPLTSFVAMSLAGGGRVDHPTTRHAVEFLRASARPDGSWPIDTHLATWLTTLAVNALGAGEGLTEMPAEERGAVRAWLLAQQYQQEHPYTHAAPGGWAWTPLSGGVPDADDTASALVALKKLGELDTQVRAAALAGAEWLLQLQNRDGGVPTFCRGWTHLPFDRSSPDLTAHAMRAWAVWQPEMPPGRQPALLRAMDRALNYLAAQQRPTGCWIPLWFGSQHAADEENPVYGTARVVSALSDLGRPESPARVQRLLQTGATWLLNAQRPDGSWGGSSAAPPSVEETALAVEALAALGGSTASHAGVPAVDQATRRGVCWLIDRVEDGTWRQPAPIGFYFAKLWYYERLYPLLFTVGALERVSQLTGGQTQDSA